MSERANDFLTVALCKECHQGDLGLHGDQTLMRIYKLDELDLLAITIGRIIEKLAKHLKGIILPQILFRG